MIAYAEAHISLSGRATSWFVSAAGFGGIAMPFLIGRLLDRSSNAMPIAVLCGALAATGSLVAVRRTLLGHRNGG
jgi:predicted MFS family arabinose efflux permease